MNNHGKSTIAFIIGLLLLTGFVISMLEMNNIINVRALLGGEGHFIPINYEKDIKELCNKLDGDGNYNLEAWEDVQKQVSENIKNNYTKDDDSADAWAKIWKTVGGTQYCSNSICFYFEEGKEPNTYTYACKENELLKINFKEEWEKIQSDLLLNTACSSVDSKGEYKLEGYASCEKFYCTVYVNGKTYSKNCIRREDN